MLYRNIRDAAVKSGRKPEDVLLLGVTKTVDVETMQKAYRFGRYRILVRTGFRNT
jgi:uncharacterized pyridoxal phosphate-containing UPF0001 family protein